jgi:hypothetical protein
MGLYKCEALITARGLKNMNSVKTSIAGMALLSLVVYIGIWGFKLFGGC